MRLTIVIILLLKIVFLNDCFAADVNEKFAVKGIGTLNCEAFVEAKDNSKTSYLQFGGWIEGYISASNRFLNTVYDIAPWQTTETIASIAYTACKNNPQAQFSGVINEIVRRLSEAPLTEQSDLMVMTHGKYSMKISVAVFEEVKYKLRGLKLLKGDASEQAIKSALKQYQKDNNLPITSLPDQYTLLNILGIGRAK